MRGSGFETGGHPYAISDRGIRVLHSPLHTLWLPHKEELRVSTGVERLDAMLLGGFLAGTTTLISGPPGAAKTTLAARFIEAGCENGERCLFVGFDEPAAQMRAGVRSVGIHLDPFIESGALVTDSFAAGATIGDEHYLAVERLIDEHRPTRVVIDPVSALDKGGGRDIADSVRERLVVLFKERGITAIFTAIADNDFGLEEMSRTRVSTIADTWINLGFTSWGGERNRTLSILKSRGTGHSNQIRELVLSDRGLDLADVYTLEGEVLSGTARAQKEQQVAAEREAEAEAISNAIERLDREGEELMRRLQEAQRGLDRLAEHRAEIINRARASDIARAKGTQAIHSLRRGEDA
jgi:circadian clock protein KaiC